jgi:hypothetical protein
MTMLDLMVIAAFFAICWLGHLPVTIVALLVLTCVLVVVRFLKGERL